MTPKEAIQTAFHETFCGILGFEWLGRGCVSDKFEQLPDGMEFKHFWACSRCGLRRYTYETGEALEARYAAYRRKYGEPKFGQLMYDPTFAPPMPKGGRKWTGVI